MNKPVKFKFNLGQQILIALIMGILSGILFGEYCAKISFLGDAIIKLIQITVLPYILVSLICNIGKLNATQAKTIAIKAGTLLLLFWAIGLFIIFMVPLIIPDWETASFFSTPPVNHVSSMNILDLYIPANIFFSLTNNFVPAVVLFSIIGGIALMNLKKKDALLVQFDIILQALTNMTNYVAALLPIGIFAIAANAAGTMEFQEFDRLAVYFAMYLLAAGILTFWVIPSLLSTCTPFKYKEIFGISKDAFITAFAAGNLFIILPILIQNITTLLEKHHLKSDKTSSIINIILPVIFCFPLLGKLLLLLFVVFAGWYSGNVIDPTQYPALAASGLFSMFGHDVVAISFLMDMFRIPADFFQLYILTTIISGRFSTLLDAVTLFTLITMATCFIQKTIRLRLNKIFSYPIITLFLLFASIAGTKFMLNTCIENTYDKDQLLGSMRLVTEPAEAVIHKKPAQNPPTFFKQALLERILDRKVLRVGYKPDRMPFCFFNGNDELVGFDIDMAHMLAKSLDIKLEFFPVTDEEMKKALDDNLVDIIMGATPLSINILSKMKLTDPYLDLTIALVVPDHLRQEVTTVKNIKKFKNLKIAIVEDKYNLKQIREALPLAQVGKIESTAQFFTGANKEWDALLTTAEEGTAWCLLYPNYQAVVPEETNIKIPLAYPIASHDPNMTRFVSLWLDIQKKNKSVKKLYDYWISGIGAEKKQPRWCIIRNVMHLIDE